MKVCCNSGNDEPEDKKTKVPLNYDAKYDDHIQYTFSIINTTEYT